MNGTLMEVKVKYPGEPSHQYKMRADRLRDFLMSIVDGRGVSLRIHTSDGTFIDVWPKCSRCGCYDAARRLRGGLCDVCSAHSEDTG